MTLKFYSIYRTILLVLSGLAIWRIPSLFYLDELWQAPFFTPEAWMAMLGLFLGGFILGFLKPIKWMQFGILLGLGPMVHTAARLANDTLGTLWAMEIFLTLVIGILPALGGAWLGTFARNLVPHLHH